MSTGGLALLLSPATQPYTFPGLLTIGKTVYIFDILLFSLITSAITFRFVQRPWLLRESIAHPTEGLFLPTAFLALASIIGCIARYGIPECGPWLVVGYRVLFWMYFAATFILAIGMYYVLFSNPSLKIEDMTPAWDLPIFPVMLSGTIASIGAPYQPTHHAVPMIVAGVAGQGLGMIISLLMYSCYIHRMIQYGFPSPASRPAMFIAVGPPAFTSVALIGMANGFPTDVNYFKTDGVNLVVTLKILATMIAVFIWCLSLWFFCISLLAVLSIVAELTFHLNWWAFVFPNVGLTLAVIAIGNQFQSEAVRWLGSVMTIGIVGTYIFVFFMHMRALWYGNILLEGKDEDTYYQEAKSKQH